MKREHFVKALRGLGILFIVLVNTVCQGEGGAVYNVTTEKGYSLAFRLLPDTVIAHQALWVRIMVRNEGVEPLPKPILRLNGPVLSASIWSGDRGMPSRFLRGYSLSAFDDALGPSDSVVEYTNIGPTFWDGYDKYVSSPYREGDYQVRIEVNIPVLEECRPCSLQQVTLPFTIRQLRTDEAEPLRLLERAYDLHRLRKYSASADTCRFLIETYPHSPSAVTVFSLLYFMERGTSSKTGADKSWVVLGTKFLMENPESPTAIQVARNLTKEKGQNYVLELLETARKGKVVQWPVDEVELGPF